MEVIELLGERSITVGGRGNKIMRYVFKVLEECGIPYELGLREWEEKSYGGVSCIEP